MTAPFTPSGESDQRLLERSLLYETIFLQSPIGISIYYESDPVEGDDDGFVSMNPVFEEITWRKKEELLRLGWAQITHPEDVKQDLYHFRRLQSGEIKHYSMEKRFLRPDGTPVWVHMVVAALDLSKNQKFKHICLIQDITERKNAEKHLRYRNEHDSWTAFTTSTDWKRRSGKMKKAPAEVPAP